MIEAIQNNNTMFRSGSQMITTQMVVAVENAEPVNLERPKFHPVTTLPGGTCSTYDSTWRI